MLSVGELVEYLSGRYPGVEWTDAEISRHTGISRDSWKKYRVEGVPMFTADEVAVRLGVHPCRVWGSWWRA